LPHDPVFFVDRNLGAECLPNELRKAGYRIVVHDDHFSKRQDVLDPEVILECSKNGWPLLTGDSAMPHRWSREIRAAKIRVFYQINNHQGPRIWAPRWAKIRLKIFKACIRWAAPCAGSVSAEPIPRLRKADFI
jgi:hypothetical protein